MARAFIRAGELLAGYEPHDLPGAWIPLRYTVTDSTGATPSASIAWDGPCVWIESRDGVPDGHTALWLGTENATRPHVVFVAKDPTPESDAYEAAYRRGFTGSRAPRVSDRMSATEIDGRLQGWSDRRKNRASTSVG